MNNIKNEGIVQELILKDLYKNKINLKYIEKILQLIYSENNENSLKKIEQLNISIPVDLNGEFDVVKQKIIAEKFNLIYELRDNQILEELKLYYKNIKIVEKNIYIFLPRKVKDLFTIERGKGIYTKTWCKNNNGEYPVYSADNNTALGYMKSYDFDGKYLTISVNGIAGVIKIIEDKFSTNADRVVLVPKISKINLEYISNTLEGKLRDIAKGRKGLENKNEFTKLTKKMIEDVEILIPFDIRGELEAKIQKDISCKYSSINSVKEELTLQVKKLLEANIIFTT